MGSEAGVVELCTAAEELEQFLGDPEDPGNALSFKRSVALDEEEQFPQEACDRLDQYGFHELYIPGIYGGRWHRTEQLLLALRLVSRRDLTVAIGHAKTFLGSAAVWLAGDASQRLALIETIRAKGAVCLALTEQAHGSDLVASEVTVVPQGETLRLSGEKWLINNATRGQALCVLARVEGKSALQMAMVFVQKKQLSPGTYAHLPKNLTHGIRGADISGIAFHDAVLPKGAVIGGLEQGLPLTLKLLQITRIGCCGLSLGAGDTALRATLDFALGRKLYGQSVFELPYAKNLLRGSFLDLLMAEAVTLCAARTLHCLPQQLSVASAIAKYLVPVTTESLVKDLSVVLGARYYLRSGHWHGAFEKLVRDNALVGLFDGSTVVNLDVLASQLPELIEKASKPRQNQEALRQLFDLNGPAPALDLSKLSFSNNGRDDVTGSLPAALEALLGEGLEGANADLRRAASEVAGGLLEQLRADQAAVARWGAEKRERFKPVPVFEMAKRYCLFYAASACLQLFLNNRAQPLGFASRPHWLVLTLARLLEKLKGGQGAMPPEVLAAVDEDLVDLFRRKQLFSLLPVGLPKS